MGCVLGREASSSDTGTKEKNEKKEKERKDLNVDSDRKVDDGTADEVSIEGTKEQKQDDGSGDGQRPPRNERRLRAKSSLRNISKHVRGEQVAAGWPPWLTDVASEAINGLIPRRVTTFEKIDKIGQGTYSNVYKAKDTVTGKFVALKKVRFDNLEPESVRFMVREIIILRRLDHPNVIKLEGLVTSRMSFSLYLMFEYMEHDLAGLIASPDIKFTEPQVKCYSHQLLSGLEHCHNHGVLHRDLKGSNLLVDNNGTLKIADFGLACPFDPDNKHPMTSRVVTLWYRPPELLLGTTDYGVGVDLWSAGCIVAELLFRRPIMLGRTEVEQLHRIFKLCGSPSDEYWKTQKFPNGTMFRPREIYKRRISETFNHFPPSSLPLIETLLAIDPAQRLTATAAMKSEFFTTEPYACDPSSLPQYPPTKEMNAKRWDEEARRIINAKKAQGDDTKKTRRRDHARRPVAAPPANDALRPNIDKRRLLTYDNAKSKSERFPPPHQDGAIIIPLGASHRINPSLVPIDDVPFSSLNEPIVTWSGPLVKTADIDEPNSKKHTSRYTQKSRK